MTVKELYLKMCERIPEDMRESWDNDGLMCCADSSAEVSRVLVTLDVTEEIVDYAIQSGANLIVSHHPLIFKPIKAVTDDGHIARKIIKLISNGVSVFSFHTRADKVAGGVNDLLADIIGLGDVRPFGEGFLGRIGDLDEECSLDDFAYRMKELLGADTVRIADSYTPVSRVAVCGGDGRSLVSDAIAEGADTFVSGRIGYNVMEEAQEMGINLVEAGHYFTEQPVTGFFYEILNGIDSGLDIEIASSNNIKTV